MSGDNNNSGSGAPTINLGMENVSPDFIRDIAPSFVHHLFTASKTTQIYELDNNATKRTITDFYEVLDIVIGLFIAGKEVSPAIGLVGLEDDVAVGLQVIDRLGIGAGRFFI